MGKNDITPGEQLTLAQINLIRKQAQGRAQPTRADLDKAILALPGRPSDGMKVDELRAALEAKGTEIPADAKKADLQKLLDEAG